MPIVRRILLHSDGREEVFKPHRDKQDRFVMATKLTGDPLHHASNQVLVETEQEMIQKLRTGNYLLRMTTGDKNVAPSLISPESIEIIELPSDGQSGGTAASVASGSLKQRALSIRHPHAEAILRGLKTIEFRSGPTKIRGRILIYASPQRYSPQEERELMDLYGITDVSCDDLVRGVILGSVELHDCRLEVGGPYPWGWHVRNPKRSKRLRKPTHRPNAVWFIPF